MADYSTIKGFTIQSLTSDPSNLLLGQVWYNTTSNTLKGYGLQGTSAWASGGNMNEGRPGLAGAGTQTAAFACAGGPPGPYKANMETYDGTSWTEVGNLQTETDYNAASGSTTAGLSFQGTSYTTQTESWNGTSWSVAGGALNTGRQQGAGFGTQTASISATGNAPPNSPLVEKYDGTSWTEVGDVNTARSYVKGGGTATSGIIGPGNPPSGITETYDGTTWTEVNNVNTARFAYGMSKDGANTSALLFAGNVPTASTLVEQWDGTSWTEVADVSNGTQECAGAGTGGFALLFGGNSPAGYTDTVEEWAAAAATKTFTAS